MIEHNRPAARWRAPLAVIFAAALQYTFGPAAGIACSCAPRRPPCEAYWQTPMVCERSVGPIVSAEFHQRTADGFVVSVIVVCSPGFPVLGC